MNQKINTFKNRQKILFSAGALLLASVFIPFLSDFKDFFLFAGISVIFYVVITKYLQTKISNGIFFEKDKSQMPLKSYTINSPIIKMPFFIKKSSNTTFLFLIIIGGFLINQFLLARYNASALSNASPTPTITALKTSLNSFDEGVISELRNQGKEPFILGTAHNHADLNIYNDGKRLVVARPENYMKSAFLHIDPNPNPDDSNSVLHMLAKNVPLLIFFRSLGMSLTRDNLTLADGQILKNGNGKTLKFYLNGQKVDELGDYSFQPLDKLLISYGPENDPNLAQQLKAMTNFAKDH